MIAIKHRYTDTTLCEFDVETVKQAAERGKANLDGANLDGANLDGANLRSASLYGASLDGTNLDGADLDGANLRSANLRSANLDGANLYRANLDGANLRSANLRSANLRSASLYGANLRGANLRGADLRGADLRGANLDGTNLDGANLGGANLDGANLGGADLDGEKPTKSPLVVTGLRYWCPCREPNHNWCAGCSPDNCSGCGAEPVDSEPAMWVMKHIRSGDLAQAKPNQKALHPRMWSQAHLYTTPQPDRVAELEAALNVAKAGIDKFLVANDPTEFGCACDLSVGYLCGPCHADMQQQLTEECPSQDQRGAEAMSSNKKRRELNRAIEEHEIAKLASSSNNAFNAAVWKAGAEKLQADNDQLRSEIAALKAENEELRKDAEWRDIETAPKDGTVFLGYKLGQFRECYKVPRDDCDMWCFGGTSGADDLFPNIKPTHWMPLPKAPANGASS